MTKAFLALGAAAVLSAAPAAAEKHYSNYVQCSKVKNGTCVSWKRLTRGAASSRLCQRLRLRAEI